MIVFVVVAAVSVVLGFQSSRLDRLERRLDARTADVRRLSDRVRALENSVIGKEKPR